ncbi:MAG: hypothetical protein KDM64_08965, partial [Verrucomicrobiae bacterium]|nr:hypothetical protein [Verrucomicrobiae bacterium]
MKTLLFLLLALGLPVLVVGQDTPPIGLPPLPFTIPPPPPDPSDTILVKDVQVSFVGTPLLTSEEVLAQLQIETGKAISGSDLRAKCDALVEAGKIDFYKVDPIIEPDGV